MAGTNDTNDINMKKMNLGKGALAGGAKVVSGRAAQLAAQEAEAMGGPKAPEPPNPWGAKVKRNK